MLEQKKEARTLPELVAGLSEVYQPIYGHPELSTRVSRPCEDRLAQITHIYDLLSAKMGRPLRVLDLGCAQGFFSLNLAKRGALVYGVDFNDGNIAVCKALAAENPELQIGFGCNRVENIIATLPVDDCDMVLGLSVFHHIVHAHGAKTAHDMLALLAQKVAVGLFEMAVASEPLAWAQSQPKNPRNLLGGYAFVHEFAQNSTHLSEITRPFYVASNRCWILDGQIEAFDRWKAEPHVFSNHAHRGTRRYFFGADKVLKLCYLDHAEQHSSNLQDHLRALEFWQHRPEGFEMPHLLMHGQYDNENWMVWEYWEGPLLVDMMRAGTPYDADYIVRNILQQLVVLEAAGFYHDDVRLWNIVMRANGKASLIDYGAMRRDKKDCEWPHTPFMAFIVFMHEVFSGVAENPAPLRAPLLDPQTLPEPYRGAIWHLMELPEDARSFSALRDYVSQTDIAEASKGKPNTAAYTVLFKAMEDYGYTCLRHAQQSAARAQEAGRALLASRKQR